MKPALRMVAVGVGILVTTEAGLRLAGRGPWAPFGDLEDLPVMSAPDPELGWVNLPGRVAWPDGGERTILADGRRGETRGDGPSIGLFGGSFTSGYGLTDADTLGQRLQAHLGRPVVAHGVPGYGTLQSLRLAQRVEPTDVVVYGLVELHDGRNVACRSWRAALERSGNGQGWAATPWARWTGEALEYGPPVGYTHWTWSERSALVHETERAWTGLLDRFERTKAETTVQLTLAFRDAVVQRGGRFVVALLEAPERGTFYADRLAANDVEVVDLREERVDSLPDGHPGPETVERWSVRLAEVL